MEQPQSQPQPQSRQSVMISSSHHHPLSATSTPLVGRETEQEALKECWKGVLQRKPGASCGGITTAFVHGKSGVGKTALIESVLQEWNSSSNSNNNNATTTTTTPSSSNNTPTTPQQQQTVWWMARGKYEQFQEGRARPYAAILNGLDSLGTQILEQVEEGSASSTNINPYAHTHHSQKEYLERHMKTALKFEGHILTKMVPSLAVYDDDNEEGSSETNNGGDGYDSEKSGRKSNQDNSNNNTTEDDSSSLQVTLAAERLAVSLLTFLTHFCTFIGPLVLFLDDVQWADPHSQQLLLTMSDKAIDNFLLIAGHRNEDDDSVTNQLQQEWLASEQVCNIPVEDLTVDQVEQLLRSVLRVFDDDSDESTNAKRDIKGLSKIVFHKTFGNPYYVLQQLEYLHKNADATILQYNFASASWEWDLEQVQLCSDSSDNVVQVVTQRIARLPIRVKRLLQLASCLGYFVEMSVLEMLEKQLFKDYNGQADEDAGLDAIMACLETASRNSASPPSFGRQVSGGGHSLSPPSLNRHQSGGGQSSGEQAGGEGSSAEHSQERVVESIPQDLVDAGDAFRQALALAEKEAFIECTNGIMKFSHDRIQQSVYELLVKEAVLSYEQEQGQRSSSMSKGLDFDPPAVITPEIRKDSHRLSSSKQPKRTNAIDIVHYCIGSQLKDYWGETQEERFLFLAVEQLDRVSSHYLLGKLTQEETLALVALNHEASKLAKKKGGMQRVSAFLNKAISLASSQSYFWRTHYEMMLDLYNASAEVEFGLGRLDSATGRIAVIREHAILESDKVRSMVIQFQMYGHQRHFDKAIAEGRKILKLLGEPIPKTSLLNIMKEYFACKRECKGKSDAFFTDLRKSKKCHIPIVLKVLQISSVYGWNGDPLYSGLAFLRAMRITVREGADVTTPFIYSGYAYMLGLFNDEKEAFRFGELALDKNEGKNTFPSSCCLTYPSVLHLQLPIAVGLEPMLSSYRVGLETGDLFFGTINISVYALIYFSSGLPLEPLVSDMCNYMTQLKICKQDIPLAFILPTCQLALNLMGHSEDPLDLSRASIRRTQPEYFSENVLVDKHDASVLYMMYLEAFEMYILNADNSRLEASMREIYKLPETRLGGPHIMNYFFVFVDGLVGLSLIRNANTKKPAKWRKTRRFGNKLVNGSLKVLRGWAKTRPVNSVSLLALLEAELNARNKKNTPQDGKRMYDRAIAQFARSGLTHYGAIANELAGLYMLEKDDDYWAEHYLSQACIRYDQWNAHVKTDMLRKEHTFVKLDDAESARFAIQGKSRYDSHRDSLERSSASMRTSIETFQSRSQRNDADSQRMSGKRYSSVRISGLDDGTNYS